MALNTDLTVQTWS